MSKTSVLFCVLLCVGTLVGRDIVLSFYTSPWQIMLTGELQEKESSEKNGNENHKEKDESKIPSLDVHSYELAFALLRHAQNELNHYDSVILEVTPRPPKGC